MVSCNVQTFFYIINIWLMCWKGHQVVGDCLIVFKSQSHLTSTNKFTYGLGGEDFVYCLADKYWTQVADLASSVQPS